jgi:XisH protein
MLSQPQSTRDLYIAFGQYILYRALLAELRDESPLYLAVPEDAFINIFEQTALRAVRDNQVKMVIVNVETETITQWIE